MDRVIRLLKYRSDDLDRRIANLESFYKKWYPKTLPKKHKDELEKDKQFSQQLKEALKILNEVPCAKEKEN